MRKQKKKLRTKISHFFRKYNIFQLFIVIALILVLIFTSSVLIIHFENQQTSQNKTQIHTFADAIWWAFVTITTVGYGDKVPISLKGRIFAIFLIIIGITLFSLLTALIASFYIGEKLKGEQGLKKIKSKEHVIICGWNSSIYSILDKFNHDSSFNQDITIIEEIDSEKFKNIFNEFPKLNLKFVKGNFTKEIILIKANIAKADTIIILANTQVNIKHSDDKAIIAVNSIRFIDSNIPITVQLANKDNKSYFKNTHKLNIISNDEITALLMVNNIKNKHFLKFHEKIISEINKIFCLEIPNKFIGKTFSDLANYFLNEENIICLGTITEKKDLQLSDIFSDNTSAIDNFIKQTLEKNGNNNIENENILNLNPDHTYIIKVEDIAIILK